MIAATDELVGGDRLQVKKGPTEPQFFACVNAVSFEKSALLPANRTSGGFYAVAINRNIIFWWNFLVTNVLFWRCRTDGTV